jgi:dipicolinate synthase subunit A
VEQAGCSRSVLSEDVKTICAAAKAADIIIGPIPFSKGHILNMPYFKETITLADLFSAMRPGQILTGGRFNSDALRLAEKNGITAIDLLDREEMAVLNAIPTAEGALQIAMESSVKTIHSSNVLVAGFGRIGKILSKFLYGLGANVYASARKYEDLSQIRAYGYHAVSYPNLNEILPNIDIIFNTVPFAVFEESSILCMKKGVIAIDLASKPFGFDDQACSKAGVKLIFAPSLPGKAAPYTAASYIKETIENLKLEE